MHTHNVKRDWVRKIYTICILTSLLFTPSACSRQNTPAAISGTQMARANQLYEASRFSEAVALYLELVDAGADEGYLYYNLGNAYFKMGDLGRAVLNFRRAQILLPRDGDVDANLALARSQTLDRIEVENEGAIVNTVRRIFGWVTVDEASIAALVLWVILCSLGISALLWSKRRRGILVISAVLALLLLSSILSIAFRLWDQRGEPPAVIVASEVELRSGPGDDYLTEFTLHAGAEVRVVERRGDWVRIALPGVLQGWAPGEAAIELFLD